MGTKEGLDFWQNLANGKLTDLQQSMLDANFARKKREYIPLNSESAQKYKRKLAEAEELMNELFQYALTGKGKYSDEKYAMDSDMALRCAASWENVALEYRENLAYMAYRGCI